MPAVYPPIAPRGPNGSETPKASEIVPHGLSHDVDAESIGQGARLAALEAAPATFVDAHHPVRDATAIALLKPAGELIKRYGARMRLLKAAQEAPADSDDPTEPAMSLGDGDDMPAILAMAETQVAKALLGDSRAYNAVADRVEGKAGLRKADLDAETAAQRQRVRQTIEELVRDMGERRRMSPAILDVTPTSDDET